MILLCMLIAASPPSWVSRPGKTTRPIEGIEVTELMAAGDSGERLLLIKATRGGQLQFDPSKPLLGITLTGEVTLPASDRPRAFLGSGNRCEPGLTVAFGAELLVLQAPAGTGPIVATPGKQKCAPNSDRLTRAESPLNEGFSLGALGSVRFLSQSPFAYAGELSLNPGAEIASHRHESSTELLVIFEGSGTVTIDGLAIPVGKGDAIRIPAGHAHAFTAGPKVVRAIQFYRPPGPEERFRPRPVSVPPIEAGCNTTADCALFAATLTGAMTCCPSCAATAVSKGWLQKLEPACLAKRESTSPCVPLPCGPVERYAVCRKGQCLVSPTP